MADSKWRERLRPAAFGLAAMIVAGAILAVALRPLGPNARGTGLGWLSLMAPALFVVGFVVFVRGLVSGAPIVSRRTVLVSGLLMLVTGGFPWAYTALIIRDRGMEGSGMLGTLIFITVGIPGILATVLGCILRGWEPD